MNSSAQLTDILAAQKSIDDPFYGLLEAGEAEDGEYRIFLSCPNVDQLEQLLHNWLHEVDWLGEFHIVKRWGHLVDRKAKEKHGFRSSKGLWFDCEARFTPLA